MKKIILTILIAIIFSGCDFIGNVFTYKDATQHFVESILREDYNKCISLMAMNHEMAQNSNADTIKLGLVNFRKLLVENWGNELEYSFMKAEKTFSTVEADNTPPNTTLVLVEFSNTRDFGILQVLFDDTTKKVLNIKTLDVKEPVPAMAGFWLFGVFAVCVPIFNIYVIRMIKRSRLSKKWLKYLAVICLNTPAITYAAINGLSFKLLSLQILLGFSFSYMGYLNSFWTFGIPLGGIYWLWKLKTTPAPPQF